MMKKGFSLFILVISLFIATTSLNAKEYNNTTALNGIKEAKTVFLIDFTDIRTTAFYMKIIQGTYASFERQGVKPKMVLVFIGKTVNFLSTAQDEAFALEYENELNSIQESIKTFSKMGVRMEVCTVATNVFKIDNSTIPKEMNLIDDGFVALVGWQTQGYKLVPIF